MTTAAFNIFFLLSTIYVFLKAVAYSLYVINSEHNKFGGISVILLSVVVVIFCNIIIWFL